MRYRRLRTLHLWLSLIVAVPLLVLSVTGALLVYGPELQRAVAPDGWTVTPAGEPLSPGTVVERVRQQRPDVDVWALAVGKAADEPYTAWLADGAGVLNIDPYSGRVLVHFHPQETFQGWVTALHRRWLVDGPAARWVRHGVSAVALLLTVQLAIGLWLWVKPRRRLRRLAVTRRYGTATFVARLHQVTGIATALILVAVTFTGMAMYWHEPTQKLVEWATMSRVEAPEPPTPSGLAPLADLDAAVEVGRAAAPATPLRSVRPPESPGDAAVMMFAATDWGVPSRIWVGDDPPRVLHHFDGSKATTATWLWHLRYWIHIGDFAGPLVRALWVVVALLPTAFVVSGLWLNLARARRKRRGGDEAADAPATMERELA